MPLLIAVLLCDKDVRAALWGILYLRYGSVYSR